MKPDDTRSKQGWFSREHALTILLGIATLIAFYLCYLLVLPFISAIAIAAAVAVATSGPYDWLRRRLRSRTAAAAIGVVLVGLVIVIPVSLFATYLVGQIVAGVQYLQAGDNAATWQSALHLPRVLGRALEWTEANLDLQAQLTRLGQFLAAKAGGLLASSIDLLTQVAIMLFVLFFLYRDRDQALNSLRSLLPLSAGEANQMFRLVADTILATVTGSLTVAFVQALLAGSMYTLLGVPGSVVWAAATFVVALVPVFGTVLVWGPVSLYLLISGSWVKALILIGWGMLAVGTIDNVLYPYLVGGRLRLHTIPTFFAIVGGVGTFGPAGLIIGPVALAITIGLLNVWRWRTSGLRGGADVVAAGVEPVIESSGG